MDWAADEAALRGVPLHVVYASLWERYEHAVFPESRKPAAERLLTDVLAVAAAKRARAPVPGLSVTTEVVPEGPVSVLRRAAHQAAVLVLGSRGREGARAPPSCCSGGGPAGRPGRRAVRVWHRPAREAPDHPRFTGESAQAHRRRAFEVLETGLCAPTEEQPDVEMRRRIVEGRARTVLPDASAEAALLVVGARQPHGRVGSHIGRVTHAVLHHAACPVAVVPELP